MIGAKRLHFPRARITAVVIPATLIRGDLRARHEVSITITLTPDQIIEMHEHYDAEESGEVLLNLMCPGGTGYYEGELTIHALEASEVPEFKAENIERNLPDNRICSTSGKPYPVGSFPARPPEPDDRPTCRKCSQRVDEATWSDNGELCNSCVASEPHASDECQDAGPDVGDVSDSEVAEEMSEQMEQSRPVDGDPPTKE